MSQNIIHILIILATIGQLAGATSYIKSTLKGKTKPNRVTWLLWAIAPMIALFAAFSNGMSWSLIGVFMSGFIPLLIFLASFANKNSYWKLEKLDYICGAFSILALILWAITKEPVIATVFAIISDGMAAVPTIIKSYKHPETETATPFMTGLISSLIGLLAIEVWSFSVYAFLIYLILINSILILLIARKKTFKSL